VRRREKPTPEARTELPPEFLIGRLIEVWSAPTPPAWSSVGTSAMSRYSAGRLAYSTAHDFNSTELAQRFRPVSAVPWSADYMDRNGRADEVTGRLATAGVSRADLPRLREAAQWWHGQYVPVHRS